jgi:hypothetical protein
VQNLVKGFEDRKTETPTPSSPTPRDRTSRARTPQEGGTPRTNLRTPRINSILSKLRSQIDRFESGDGEYRQLVLRELEGVAHRTCSTEEHKHGVDPAEIGDLNGNVSSNRTKSSRSSPDLSTAHVHVLGNGTQFARTPDMNSTLHVSDGQQEAQLVMWINVSPTSSPRAGSSGQIPDLRLTQTSSQSTSSSPLAYSTGWGSSMFFGSPIDPTNRDSIDPNVDLDPRRPSPPPSYGSVPWTPGSMPEFSTLQTQKQTQQFLAQEHQPGVNAQNMYAADQASNPGKGTQDVLIQPGSKEGDAIANLISKVVQERITLSEALRTTKFEALDRFAIHSAAHMSSSLLAVCTAPDSVVQHSRRETPETLKSADVKLVEMAGLKTATRNAPPAQPIGSVMPSTSPQKVKSRQPDGRWRKSWSGPVASPWSRGLTVASEDSGVPRSSPATVSPHQSSFSSGASNIPPSSVSQERAETRRALFGSSSGAAAAKEYLHDDGTIISGKAGMPSASAHSEEINFRNITFHTQLLTRLSAPGHAALQPVDAQGRMLHHHPLQSANHTRHLFWADTPSAARPSSAGHADLQHHQIQSANQIESQAPSLHQYPRPSPSQHTKTSSVSSSRRYLVSPSQTTISSSNTVLRSNVATVHSSSTAEKHSIASQSNSQCHDAGASCNVTALATYSKAGYLCVGTATPRQELATYSRAGYLCVGTAKPRQQALQYSDAGYTYVTPNHSASTAENYSTASRSNLRYHDAGAPETPMQPRQAVHPQDVRDVGARHSRTTGNTHHVEASTPVPFLAASRRSEGGPRTPVELDSEVRHFGSSTPVQFRATLPQQQQNAQQHTPNYQQFIRHFGSSTPVQFPTTPPQQQQIGQQHTLNYQQQKYQQPQDVSPHSQQLAPTYQQQQCQQPQQQYNGTPHKTSVCAASTPVPFLPASRHSEGGPRNPGELESSMWGSKARHYGSLTPVRMAGHYPEARDSDATTSQYAIHQTGGQDRQHSIHARRAQHDMQTHSSTPTHGLIGLQSPMGSLHESRSMCGSRYIVAAGAGSLHQAGVGSKTKSSQREGKGEEMHSRPCVSPWQGNSGGAGSGRHSRLQGMGGGTEERFRCVSPQKMQIL